MNLPGQLITEALYTATLLIYIYVYRREINPPGQLITEALHTISLLIYSEVRSPPKSIKHRCLAYHYTAYI